MIQRPIELAAFEFAVLAGLRAGQLARGCTPRVTCAHKITVIARNWRWPQGKLCGKSTESRVTFDSRSNIGMRRGVECLPREGGVPE